jgi:circadian clock protein KaiB
MKPRTSRRAKVKFQLFVAGDTHNSAEARTNLTAFCQAYLKDQHTIEVVNVFKEPKRALANGILMTPTLMKLAPKRAPIRIIGTLSQTQPLLQALGLGIDAA